MTGARGAAVYELLNNPRSGQTPLSIYDVNVSRKN
jgi:hypothetical protein